MVSSAGRQDGGLAAAGFDARAYFLSDAAIVLTAALIAASLQLPHPALPDVGWLTLVAERMLAGETLYVDIVEVNPPMSAFLYFPVALLHKATGLALAPTVVFLTSVLAGLAIFLSTAILRRGGLVASGWRFPTAAAFALLVLPLATFGQREHIAAIAILPLLAAIAVRAEGNRAPLALSLLAGLSGGLGMSVKPHFVLAGLAPVLYAFLRTRSLRVLFPPENWAAGAFVATYALIVLLLYPAFLGEWLPIVRDTYRMVRDPLLQRFAEPASIGIALMVAGLAAMLGRRIAAPLPAALVLSGLGFFAAAVEQGKMWNNHLYPAIALISLAVLTETPGTLARRDDRSARLLPALAYGLAALGLSLTLSTLAARPATTIALAPAIRAIQPERPRLYALSGSIAAGNPLTAEVRGVWTGAAFGQWLHQFSEHILAKETVDAAARDRLLGYQARDRDAAETAIVAGRPDFLLVDRATYDWLAWARADPALSAALSKYTQVGASAGVELWARRDRLRGRSPGANP